MNDICIGIGVYLPLDLLFVVLEFLEEEDLYKLIKPSNNSNYFYQLLSSQSSQLFAQNVYKNEFYNPFALRNVSDQNIIKSCTNAKGN